MLNFIQYITENYATISYKDLVKKYINTGMCIPEYQLNKLNIQDKKTYLRKRLQAFEISEVILKDYEEIALSNEQKTIYLDKIFNKKYLKIQDSLFDFCSTDQKLEYINRCIKHPNNLLTLKQFDWCNEELKKEYILSIIKNSINFNDEILINSSNDIKIFYIKNLFQKRNYFKLSDNLLETCDEEFNLFYLEMLVKYGVLDKKQFLSCNDRQKWEYIWRTRHSGFHDYEFDSCTDDQKTMLFNYIISTKDSPRPGLSFHQFLYYSNDKKMTYIILLRKASIKLNIEIQEWLFKNFENYSEDVKKEFIDLHLQPVKNYCTNNLKTFDSFYKEFYDYLTIMKNYYLEKFIFNVIGNLGRIDDDFFDILPDNIKLYAAKTTLEKNYRPITDHQKEWYENYKQNA